MSNFVERLVAGSTGRRVSDAASIRPALTPEMVPESLHLSEDRLVRSSHPRRAEGLRPAPSVPSPEDRTRESSNPESEPAPPREYPEGAPAAGEELPAGPLEAHGPGEAPEVSQDGRDDRDGSLPSGTSATSPREPPTVQVPATEAVVNEVPEVEGKPVVLPPTGVEPKREGSVGERFETSEGPEQGSGPALPEWPKLTPRRGPRPDSTGVIKSIDSESAREGSERPAGSRQDAIRADANKTKGLAEEPTVTINIGRIEVRAVPPEKPAAEKHGPAISLEDYRKMRRERSA